MFLRVQPMPIISSKFKFIHDIHEISLVWGLNAILFGDYITNFTQLELILFSTNNLIDKNIISIIIIVFLIFSDKT